MNQKEDDIEEPVAIAGVDEGAEADGGEILVKRTSQAREEGQQKTNAFVYFRWSTVMNCFVLVIFLPYAMAWIARGGLWNMEASLGTMLPQLDVHAWTAFASVAFLLHQGITGPTIRILAPTTSTISTKSDIRRQSVVRLAHRIGGWVTATLLSIVCVTGIVIALQYFNVDVAHSTYHAKASLGVATMGIISIGILAGAVISVKKKIYSAHKDLMIGLMVYVFVGAGIIRWMGSLFLLSTNGECYAPWQAAVVISISYLLLQPTFLAVIYWRLRTLNKWYNRLLIALSGVIWAMSFVSLGITYGANWGCPS